MSFQRKIARKQMMARAKERKNDGPTNNSRTDAIIDFLESSPSMAREVYRHLSVIQSVAGVAISPMELCFPFVHVENEAWIRELSILEQEDRLYARNGYLSGRPMLTKDLAENAPFLREQIASEMKAGIRERPEKQATAVVFHADGTAEFFFFRLATPSKPETAEEVSHGEDTSVSFGLGHHEDALLLHVGDMSERRGHAGENGLVDEGDGAAGVLALDAELDDVRAVVVADQDGGEGLADHGDRVALRVSFLEVGDAVGGLAARQRAGLGEHPDLLAQHLLQSHIARIHHLNLLLSHVSTTDFQDQW